MRSNIFLFSLSFNTTRLLIFITPFIWSTIVFYSKHYGKNNIFFLPKTQFEYIYYLIYAQEQYLLTQKINYLHLLRNGPNFSCQHQRPSACMSLITYLEI